MNIGQKGTPPKLYTERPENNSQRLDLKTLSLSALIVATLLFALFAHLSSVRTNEDPILELESVADSRTPDPIAPGVDDRNPKQLEAADYGQNSYSKDQSDSIAQPAKAEEVRDRTTTPTGQLDAKQSTTISLRAPNAADGDPVWIIPASNAVMHLDTQRFSLTVGGSLNQNLTWELVLDAERLLHFLASSLDGTFVAVVQRNDQQYLSSAFSLTAGEVHRVEVILPEAYSIVGEVLLPARLQYLYPQLSVIASLPTQEDRRRSSLTERGEFRLNALTPGAYTLALEETARFLDDWGKAGEGHFFTSRLRVRIVPERQVENVVWDLRDVSTLTVSLGETPEMVRPYASFISKANLQPRENSVAEHYFSLARETQQAQVHGLEAGTYVASTMWQEGKTGRFLFSDQQFVIHHGSASESSIELTLRLYDMSIKAVLPSGIEASTTEQFQMQHWTAASINIDGPETSKTGEFTLSALMAGEHRVRVYTKGYTSDFHAFTLPAIDGNTTHHLHLYPAGQIRCVVRGIPPESEHRAVFDMLKVALYFAEHKHGSEVDTVEINAKTADGVSQEILPTGRYEFQVYLDQSADHVRNKQHSDYWRFQANPVDVYAGSESLAELHAVPCGAILLNTSLPLEGQKLNLSLSGRQSAEPLLSITVGRKHSTEKEHQWRIGQVPPGQYRLEVSIEGNIHVADCIVEEFTDASVELSPSE